MSDQSQSLDSTFEEIATLCSCPICFVVYKAPNGPEKSACPRILTCGHSHCSECISKCTQANGNEHLVKCSKCQTNTRGTKEELDNLPINFDLIGMVDSIGLSSQDPLMECSSCAKKHTRENIRVCLDCDEEGCTICLTCAVDEHNGHDLVKYDGKIAEARADGIKKLAVVESEMQLAKEQIKMNLDEVIINLQKLAKCYSKISLPIGLIEKVNKLFRSREVDMVVQTSTDLSSIVKQFGSELVSQCDFFNNFILEQLNNFKCTDATIAVPTKYSDNKACDVENSDKKK